MMDSSKAQALRDQFDRDGYLVLADVLEGEALGQIRDKAGELKLPCPGEFHGLLEHAPEFVDLLDQPTLLPAVLQILGAQIHVIHSSIVSVPTGAGSMCWHEDGPRPWSYPSVDGARALVLVRVGIPLEEPSEGNHGHLVVIPGSHKKPFPHPDDAESLWDDPNVTPVRIPAGGAVLFHNGLWHSTAPNEALTKRRQIYLVFAPMWHKTLDYTTPPQSLVNAIASREESRQGILLQLIGQEGPDGPMSAMFAEESHAPALALLTPDKPASGA